MAGKKTTKSALDYDPLAWLDDAAENSESGASDTKTEVTPAAQKPKAASKAAPKTARTKAVSKSAAKPKAKSKAAPLKTQGKAEQTTQPSVSEAAPEQLAETDQNSTVLNESAPVDNGTNETNLGYGFFDQDDESTDSDNTTVADNLSSAESTPTAPMPEAQIDEDLGYGFFDDASDHTEEDAAKAQAASSDDGSPIVDTGAELTIRNIAGFKEHIDELLATGTEFRLSAQELQKIDTSGVQLLYSLRQTLAKTGLSIRWAHSSNIINDAARVLGLPDLADPVSDEEQGFGFFADDDAAAQNNQTSDAQDSAFGFF